jgi:hypothetical protein
MNATNHPVGTLLVRIADGRVYAGRGLHVFVCEDHGLDVGAVVACGFVVKGPRVIWEDRKPGENGGTSK